MKTVSDAILGGLAVESQILLLALLQNSTKVAQCICSFKQGGEFVLKFICKGRVLGITEGDGILWSR